jgi:hypothetical protein
MESKFKMPYPEGVQVKWLHIASLRMSRKTNSLTMKAAVAQENMT